MRHCKRCGRFTKKHRTICKKCLPEQCGLCRKFMRSSVCKASAFCGKPCNLSLMLDKALGKMRKKMWKQLCKPSPFFKMLHKGRYLYKMNPKQVFVFSNGTDPVHVWQGKPHRQGLIVNIKQ